jgi:hypothetical protein
MCKTPTTPMDRAIAIDLLQGLGPLAEFYFGEDNASTRRRVQYLSSLYLAGIPNGLPVFKLGQMICARPSELRKLGLKRTDNAPAAA